MINYHQEKKIAKDKEKRTLRIYPPIFFSKRNDNSAFSIKIFDTEMMRDILAENYYLDDSGKGCLTIDFTVKEGTKRIYSYIPTESLRVLYGEENPNFFGLTKEQRQKILDERENK